MIVKRGEIWFANLNPTRGTEQSGFRPVVIFQADIINKFSSTVLAIPLTTNLERTSLPTCVLVSKGEGNLSNDSVVLYHQVRVLDKKRLQKRIGSLNSQTLSVIENRMLTTMGIV